jgi:hypothetical protein
MILDFTNHPDPARLERLCAALRVSLAEAGVSAAAITEPLLVALATFEERLEQSEAPVAFRPAPFDPSAPPRTRARCLPRIGQEDVCQRCGGPTSPDIDRPCPATI